MLSIILYNSRLENNKRINDEEHENKNIDIDIKFK